MNKKQNKTKKLSQINILITYAFMEVVRRSKICSDCSNNFEGSNLIVLVENYI